jgi:hypothetical protein
MMSSSLLLGLDLVDGTPVLDVKPYVPCDSVPLDSKTHLSGSYAQCLQTKTLGVPSWIVDEDIRKRPVEFTDEARTAVEDILRDEYMRFCENAEEAFNLISQVNIHIKYNDDFVLTYIICDYLIGSSSRYPRSSSRSRSTHRQHKHKYKYKYTIV